MSGELLIKTFEWRKPRAAHFRWMVRGTIFVTIDFKWEKQESSLFGRVLIHDSCRSKYYSKCMQWLMNNGECNKLHVGTVVNGNIGRVVLLTFS